MSLSDRAKYFLHKYREQVMYLIFGVGTTVVSYGVFWVFHRMLGDSMVWLSELISFLAAVIFAYITNKLYVFQNRDWSPRHLWKELSAFLAARIFSFFIEEAGMILCVQVFHAGEHSLLGIDGAMVSKIAMSVIVVIINYFFSKLFVFRRENGAKTQRGGKSHDL